jgi:hypothetical protein
MEDLQATLTEVGEKIYKATAQEAAPQPGQGHETAQEEGSDEVVDADYEVKE